MNKFIDVLKDLWTFFECLEPSKETRTSMNSQANGEWCWCFKVLMMGTVDSGHLNCNNVTAGNGVHADLLGQMHASFNLKNNTNRWVTSGWTEVGDDVRIDGILFRGDSVNLAVIPLLKHFIGILNARIRCVHNRVFGFCAIGSLYFCLFRLQTNSPESSSRNETEIRIKSKLIPTTIGTLFLGCRHYWVEYQDTMNNKHRCLFETSEIFGSSRTREQLIGQSKENESNDNDLRTLIDSHRNWCRVKTFFTMAWCYAKSDDKLSRNAIQTKCAWRAFPYWKTSEFSNVQMENSAVNLQLHTEWVNSNLKCNDLKTKE